MVREIFTTERVVGACSETGSSPLSTGSSVSKDARPFPQTERLKTSQEDTKGVERENIDFERLSRDALGEIFKRHDE